MNGGGSTTVPVARRTRLQLQRHSVFQESSQRRTKRREVVEPRRPGKMLSGSGGAGSSTSEEANSEPECRPKINAVEDSEFVEFLMIDRDGSNLRKFYLDPMTLKNHELDSGGAGCCKSCRDCVCRRSTRKKNSPVVVGSKQGNASSARPSPRVSSRVKNSDSEQGKRLSKKGKGISIRGGTSVCPITLSDDEQDDIGEDDEPKDPSANKLGDGDEGGNVSKGSKEWMPQKKRYKFEEQELPGLEMNSSLVDVDVNPYMDMKGVNPLKEMNSTAPETTEIREVVVNINDDDDDGCIFNINGEHLFIVDEQVRIICQFCSYVKMEIKYVAPTFTEIPMASIKKEMMEASKSHP